MRSNALTLSAQKRRATPRSRRLPLRRSAAFSRLTNDQGDRAAETWPGWQCAQSPRSPFPRQRNRYDQYHRGHDQECARGAMPTGDDGHFLCRQRFERRHRWRRLGARPLSAGAKTRSLLTGVRANLLSLFVLLLTGLSRFVVSMMSHRRRRRRRWFWRRPSEEQGYERRSEWQTMTVPAETPHTSPREPPQGPFRLARGCGTLTRSVRGTEIQARTDNRQKDDLDIEEQGNIQGCLR